MSNRYVEKNFLWLLALSLLLHLAVYKIIPLIPAEKPKGAEQTTMVDLTDLPAPPPKPEKPRPEPEMPRREVPKTLPLPSTRPEPPRKSLVDRFADQRQRVAREPAPRPAHQSERPAPTPRATAPARPAETRIPQATTPARKAEPVPLEKGGSEPVARGEGILKPRSAERSAPRLFPSANRLARLEDSYRKKYAAELEDGDTSFLNTDDIRFGSFLRRLETAIYGVWQYPREALMRGQEGTTPVRITFNRRGEIVHVELLESSGSDILDNEVMRTLRTIGPIGSFPRGYTSESFKLIAFFHYGNGSGRLH